MRNLMFATLAATVLASSVGCCCGHGLFQPWGCSDGCGCGSCGGCGGGWGSWGGGWGGWGGGGCGCGGCSSCGSGGSCGCNDCGYSSRFGNSDGYASAARYTNGGPPSAYGGAPWLSNGGCSCNHCPHGPGFGLGGPCAGKQRASKCQQAPPMAQMPYPYYANRGPRDYLAKNPPSIGP